jgi:iron(III) transport system substrate-binding protein
MRAMLRLVALATFLTVLAACGAEAPDDTAGEPAGDEEAAQTAPADEEPEPVTLRLYTTVTQDTVDLVLEAFADETPEVDVEVFRAPTGEFNARVAAERREGRIQADVFWLTDPLSMLQFDDEGLLASWTPENVEEIDERYRGERYWGTRLLNLMIVAHSDVEDPPESWDDLTDVEGGVVLPDPGFAGSAFGALGYFALDDAYGIEFYERLADAGATQVNAPGEVVAAVAEGRAAAGITLDRIARDAEGDGSPIQLIWPEPGAIVVDSPIAVLDTSEHRDAAERFVEFVLGKDGQTAVKDSGWQPVRGDVPWDYGRAETLHPDWDAAFARQDELLEQYRAIFGG